ncbi:MAG: hypothetical protein ACRC4L_00085 [Mycoplasma sp.]
MSKRNQRGKIARVLIIFLFSSIFLGGIGTLSYYIVKISKQNQISVSSSFKVKDDYNKNYSFADIFNKFSKDSEIKKEALEEFISLNNFPEDTKFKCLDEVSTIKDDEVKIFIQSEKHISNSVVANAPYDLKFNLKHQEDSSTKLISIIDSNYKGTKSQFLEHIGFENESKPITSFNFYFDIVNPVIGTDNTDNTELYIKNSVAKYDINKNTVEEKIQFEILNYYDKRGFKIINKDPLKFEFTFNFLPEIKLI